MHLTCRAKCQLNTGLVYCIYEKVFCFDSQTVKNPFAGAGRIGLLAKPVCLDCREGVRFTECPIFDVSIFDVFLFLKGNRVKAGVSR